MKNSMFVKIQYNRNVQWEEFEIIDLKYKKRMVKL